MDESNGYRALNLATSQLDRRQAAPAPQRVKVDGRSLAQLLAFSAEYGTLITFYDLNDRPDGDWAPFFASDPAIALAMLAGLDRASIEAGLHALLAALRRSDDGESRFTTLRRLVGAISRLIRILDHGQRATGEAGSGLAQTVRHEIRGNLAGPVRALADALAVLPPERGDGLDLSELSDVWHPDADAPTSAVPSRWNWFDQVLAHLNAVVAALLAALAGLGDEAGAALEASVNEKGHAPQNSLYIAFAILFGYAQDTVNTFPERLLDFYYRDVLRQIDRAAVPNQVYLTFTPADGVAETAVPAGTLFPVGTDTAGDAINYAAGRSLEVHALALSALRTVRRTTEPLIDPVSDPALTAPGRVLSGEAVLSDKAPILDGSFPVFGAAGTGTEGALVTVPASLGFAVASSTLLMEAGKRDVTLRLDFSAKSLAEALPSLQAIGAAAGGMAPSNALVALLQEGFDLAYSSGADGWTPITDPSVTPVSLVDGAVVSSAYNLAFSLSPIAAPFVAPDADAAAQVGLAETARPVLLARLRQERVNLGGTGAQVAVYPYAVLSSLRLSALTVTVKVSGLTALEMTSVNGEVSQTQPFAPFGSPAATGSTLSITAFELFVKTLDSLSLDLAWYDLPQTTTGFKGWYQGYVVDAEGKQVPPGTVLFDNQSFKARLTLSNPGLWSLMEAEPWLFRTDPGKAEPAADKPVLPGATMDGLSVSPAVPPAYYDPKCSRLLLTLSSPPYAFGDSLYPQNVTAAALQETALVSGCSQLCAEQCADDRAVADKAAALAAIQRANDTASDGQYKDSVSAAVTAAVQELTTAARGAVDDALAASGADPEQIARWRSELEAIFANGSTGTNGGTPRNGLFRWRQSSSATAGAEQTAAALAGWIGSHADGLGAAAASDLDRARTLLDAGATLTAAWSKVAGKTPDEARPAMAAALKDARATLAAPYDDCMQACLADCTKKGRRPYPNAPWQPMLATLSLDYGARSSLPVSATVGDTFFHLLPFDRAAAVDWPSGVAAPLLAAQTLEGSLYAGLSGVAAGTLTLLFQMTPGAAGWSSDPPPVSWSQAVAGEWVPILPPDGLQGDGTDGLQTTGIVTLELPRPVAEDDAAVWLRLGVEKNADRFPLLAGLTPNALTAVWAGPGRAETLGTPLPAGTITASAPPLDDIAVIDQPLASFGGRARLTGSAFQGWMAERLRHKNRAVQGWDYARLVLADFPTLWQAAALPAGNGPGQPPPGSVRLVVVAGPGSPDITDATVPLAAPATLAAVGDRLAALTSPFVSLEVANPDYVRITVTATLVFSDADTVAAWTATLKDELIRWLSPWPDASLGPRPADYFTSFAVAAFMRGRPYVRAILSLDLSYTPEPGSGWVYYTSALSHELYGKSMPAVPARTAADACAGVAP